MRLIKYLTILILLLLSVISAAWYYVTMRVANEINTKYANKEFSVSGIDKNDYFISFSKVIPSGFPFKISWELHDLKQEGKNTEISNLSPVKFGYDLLRQQIFVHYDGDVTSMYKPTKNGFGAKLKISNSSAIVKLPLTASLISTLKNMDDPTPIINHIGNINISNGNVKIFDLVDNEKFYDQKYENIKLTFTPAKKYKNLEDLLNNIPKHYTIDYVVNIAPSNSTKIRKLPAGFFYGSLIHQSGTDIAFTSTIKTPAKNIGELRNNFEVKAKASCNIPWLNISNIKLNYLLANNNKNETISIKSASNLYLKDGAFDDLFVYYRNRLAPYIKSQLPSGETIDKEIQYVIDNKDKFNFKELENVNYDIQLTMNSNNSKTKRFTNVDNFSIFSKKSGFRLKHKIEQNAKKDPKWLVDGTLFVKNYPSIIEFSSGYIYRFGKFKLLSDDAKKLYIDVNTKFLQDIADKTKEDPNNIRFTYSADSRHLSKARLGSVKAKQIPQLYSLMLYKKLLGKVGYKGDVVSKMKKIIPDINKNDSLLKKILPKVSGNSDNNIDKQNTQEINKQIPKNTKDILNKAIGNGKLDHKKLLKNFVK